MSKMLPVQAPFTAVQDPALPLASVLDPEIMQEKLSACLGEIRKDAEHLRLEAIEVLAYKPGRRCVLAFKIRLEGPELSLTESPERPRGKTESLTLIGKLRSRHRASRALQQMEKLWHAGFQANSPDGISVPRPVACIPEYNLWLQQKVPGQLATDCLGLAGGRGLVERIAEAAHKLHRASLPTKRIHRMSDEIRILQEKLPLVLEEKPQWSGRINRLLEAASRLADRTPEPRMCGIHRDFYADQVVVNGRRICLLDFDLYCQGDPGLDIGNFIGHITELSLRTFGNPEALRHLEDAMETRFVALAGEGLRPAVRAYANLTLVRHIYLSTLFPERRPFTETLLDLCETRLKQAGTWKDQ